MEHILQTVPADTAAASEAGAGEEEAATVIEKSHRNVYEGYGVYHVRDHHRGDHENAPDWIDIPDLRKDDQHPVDDNRGPGCVHERDHHTFGRFDRAYPVWFQNL